MDFMDLAIEEAKKAEEKGEIPVGAVIVKDGVVLAKAHNLKETLKKPMAHAEMLVIEEACNKLDNWRLSGTEMYVTLEPCPMCAAAIAQSRISKLYIGTFNKDMGACGSTINLLDYDIFNFYVDVKWCYNDECSKILTNFFNKRRREK
ncbi:nucleoside deaminase [Clostridium chauvoei]|uniref:tRNA-specific adenosine deaminase n=2 Tax=Clostridium chauvoei TaxID=46867 RepID=S6EUF2_9CLOT|nr:nucleoside deaminase [Clostridium chauvoei]ATD56075.1 tRNA-specific adenosine deaminase [Clostridium chauvoei]ATD58566.1 tRNA-specific adenosine deaminase [Clostridium chauvoei]MBX7281386.1 nucleoside deaminase [Clostridium chauvoei]MBX7283906.1 nucleoside deaminase [Clostridium chauvoei]MBX7286475.1 nucleoside deaminase [Clostridium chauvoei]